MSKIVFAFALVISVGTTHAQSDRWQQRVRYTMDVNVDAAANTFSGHQQLEYSNNSPDTLRRVFYHLYWNAFQPGSMMDERSLHMGKLTLRGQPEWDSRVRDRISKLKDDEIGYQKIKSLSMNGVPQKWKVHETILEVTLTKPILPHTKANFTLDFNAQVPLQVRRSGRDAANGVRFSMSQWYPKICEYDREGWHPTPYVAREFYGVWGDFDVKISIDKNYILGATGYLQNPAAIGYGYEDGAKVTRPATPRLTWHFIAPNVHDFVWAADTAYKHLVRKIPGGPVVNVLYKTGDEAQWNEVADAAVAVFPYIVKTFGAYPYKQYSFIQGGDGGMEYPMATLINGPGLGTVFHEWMHSWYQGMLGTNESLYAWMDEGFTDWASQKVQAYYRDAVIRKRVQNNPQSLRIMDSMDNLLPRYFAASYSAYYFIAKSGLEEPLSTHADHFETNTAYSIASYAKGTIFLSQLAYIVGDSTLNKIMLEYYRTWRYKHPDADDFMRIAENVSDMKLDWYKEYWVNTTKKIDYSIDSLWEEGGGTKIRLRNVGQMPMPIDVAVQYKDGSKEIAYIPMDLMFGSKELEDKTVPRTEFPEWNWTNPTYTFTVNKKIATIKRIEIDETQRMADTDRKNNLLDIKW